MRPIFEQTGESWRDYLIGETSIGTLSVSVVDQRYKSIIYQNSTRLYDLENDPLETKDLASDATHAEIVARHRDHFREYITQIEMYPEPETGHENWKRGNLYKEYIDWYTAVLNQV